MRKFLFLFLVLGLFACSSEEEESTKALAKYTGMAYEYTIITNYDKEIPKYYSCNQRTYLDNWVRNDT